MLKWSNILNNLYGSKAMRFARFLLFLSSLIAFCSIPVRADIKDELNNNIQSGQRNISCNQRFRSQSSYVTGGTAYRVAGDEIYAVYLADNKACSKNWELYATLGKQFIPDCYRNSVQCYKMVYYREDGRLCKYEKLFHLDGSSDYPVKKDCFDYKQY